MSKSNRAQISVDCPQCPATLTRTVPPEPDPTSFRLWGSETTCPNCGHELAVYYS